MGIVVRIIVWRDLNRKWVMEVRGIVGVESIRRILGMSGEEKVRWGGRDENV